LEVASNPFCAKAECRRTLIVRLRLHRLDGELLIRNLKAGTPAKSRPLADGAPPGTFERVPAARPQTAPAAGTRSSMGLFRDAALDTNPILLEYLVDGVCPPEECAAVHAKKSFVGSLRSLASSMQHVSALTPSQVASLMAGDESGIETIGASPQDVIRRLLKTVEVQQAELKRAHEGAAERRHAELAAPAEVQAADEVARLRNEVKRLEGENKSMWILHEQNKMYKQQLSQTCERLADSVLLQDNECLRMQLKRLTDKFHALEERVRMGTAAPTGIAEERPRTAEQIVQQFESYDAEIAALLKRNSLMFDEIKADLQATKRELSRADSSSAQPLAPVGPALDPVCTPDPNRGKRGSVVGAARGGLEPVVPSHPPSYARPIGRLTSPKSNKA
jgi:hypothetical protein